MISEIVSGATRPFLGLAKSKKKRDNWRTARLRSHRTSGEVTITSGKKSTGSAADNTAFSPSAGYGLQAQAMKEGLFLGQFKTSDKLENNDLYYSTPFGWAAAGTGGTPYSAEVRAANGLATAAEARQADSEGQSAYQSAVNAQLNQAAIEGYNEAQSFNNPFNLAFKAGKITYDLSPIHTGISAYKSYNQGDNSGAAINTAAVLLPMLKIGKVASIVEEESTTLFRAVSKAELDDIGINGIRNATGYESGKLFATTVEDAANFGRLNYGLDKEAFTIIKTTIPNKYLSQLYQGKMDLMNAVSVPKGLFNQLSKPKVFNYSPIPNHPFIK